MISLQRVEGNLKWIDVELELEEWMGRSWLPYGSRNHSLVGTSRLSTFQGLFQAGGQTQSLAAGVSWDSDLLGRVELHQTSRVIRAAAQRGAYLEGQSAHR